MNKIEHLKVKKFIKRTQANSDFDYRKTNIKTCHPEKN